MKLTLSIPDELYEKYESRFLATLSGEQAAAAIPAERAQAAIGQLLLLDVQKAQVHVAPGWLHVSPEEVRKLGSLLAGAIPDGKHLVERVEALSHVSIGGIRLEFTAKQLLEIANKAKRNDCTPEEFLKRLVKTMEPLFFSGNV